MGYFYTNQMSYSKLKFPSVFFSCSENGMITYDLSV